MSAGRTRGQRVAVFVALGLSLALVLVNMLLYFGADAGLVGGLTLAFALWLGLFFVGWRWFKGLDRTSASDDEEDSA